MTEERRDLSTSGDDASKVDGVKEEPSRDIVAVEPELIRLERRSKISWLDTTKGIDDSTRFFMVSGLVANCAYDDSLRRVLFFQWAGVQSRKILNRFMLYGATTKYECLRENGISRQNFENTIDILLAYRLIAETGEVKYPGTPGEKQKIYSMILANKEAVDFAAERFIQLKDWERMNQRLSYDPITKKICDVLMEKYLKHYKYNRNEKEILPWIKEWIKENKYNNLDIEETKFRVIAELRKRGYEVWLSGHVGGRTGIE